MAKKEPTIADAVTLFNDVLNRSQAESIVREDRILYASNAKKKNAGMIFVLDQSLWNAVSEDKDFKCRELNPADKDDREIIDRLVFAKSMDEGWLDISTESMMNDDRIFINIEGFEYQIEINKTIWPLRFKKAEFNGFAYRIFTSPYNVFAVRKKFEGPVPDSSFYIMRAFKII